MRRKFEHSLTTVLWGTGVNGGLGERMISMLMPSGASWWSIGKMPCFLFLHSFIHFSPYPFSQPPHWLQHHPGLHSCPLKYILQLWLEQSFQITSPIVPPQPSYEPFDSSTWLSELTQTLATGPFMNRQLISASLFPSGPTFSISFLMFQPHGTACCPRYMQRPLGLHVLTSA